MSTNINPESCQVARQVGDSGSSVEGGIFPHKVPQEVLDKILYYLCLYDFRNLAVTCKNLYEGLLPALYCEQTHTRALVYAARYGRIETLRRMQKIQPNLEVNTDPYDTITGGPTTYFLSWPPKFPPRTTELVISITHGHPNMAKALIEAGADNRPGGYNVFVCESPQLAPIHWLMDQMFNTTEADKMKQWKQVLEALLDNDAEACPDPDYPGKRRLSALAQSIHLRLPLDVTSMLIKKGNLCKKHMVSNSKYGFFGKKTLSPLNLAKNERDLDDRSSSTSGHGRARLAMIRKVIYRKGTQILPKAASTNPQYRC
ncbi:hypothetical protein PG985_003793 [Apiospora marii]|uniref:uncharacterized protein n=1 Tax=Apiospora marii TaxID=335849 RepID=UPI00312D6564